LPKPKKLTLWNQEFEKDSYWMFQQLSTICFTLCGFSLTALSVIVGFFRENLSSVSILVSSLMVSTALYIWSGEMAREAYRVSKYFFAEAVYLFSSAVVSSSLLLYFLTIQPLGIDWRLLLLIVIALFLPIGYAVWRGIHNVAVVFQVWIDWRRRDSKLSK
jgi:hypothetical protein